MTYGSLFAGAGGVDLGFDRAGLSSAWQVELDPTARAVLGRHWPDVPKHEDVREVGKRNLSKVDVICGGSPCQSFSVAGQRAGTDGTSNIFREMVRVCAELKPRFVVWENVPGVFSGFDEVSDAIDPDGGRHRVGDGTGEHLRSWWMGSVLGAFSDIGFDGAWRVLDAQHWGVPQRRRRVFAVFARQSRGHSGAERCREILALTPSVRRDHPTGRQAREGLAYCLAASAGSSSSRVGQGHNTTFIPTSPAVTAKWAKGSGGPAGDECQNLVAFAQNQRDEVRNLNGLAGALAAEPGMKQQTYIAFDDQSGTLHSQPHARSRAAGVRRLTPRECEALMSWPRDHTRYRADGSEIADGPRYRLCGNGVVSNVAEWIGKRLESTRC